MKITFLGTRGNIKIKSKWHKRHTATLISHRSAHLMIDCGIEWKNKVKKVNPDAIIITHAHPDHAGGLKNNAPCPVYATKDSWKVMKRYTIQERNTVKPNISYTIGSITFIAFPVHHALNAPAVGYRITAGKTTIFYIPDLVSIKRKTKALSGIKLYIGDGAIITRKILVRKHGRIYTGHSPIITQLQWCKELDVPQAIFTHCGSEITKAHHKELQTTIKNLGKKYGVKASVAYDGMVIKL